MWFVIPKRDERGIPYYAVCNNMDDRECKFDCDKWAQTCADTMNKKEGGE